MPLLIRLLRAARSSVSRVVARAVASTPNCGGRGMIVDPNLSATYTSQISKFCFHLWDEGRAAVTHSALDLITPADAYLIPLTTQPVSMNGVPNLNMATSFPNESGVKPCQLADFRWNRGTIWLSVGLGLGLVCPVQQQTGHVPCFIRHVHTSSVNGCGLLSFCVQFWIINSTLYYTGMSIYLHVRSKVTSKTEVHFTAHEDFLSLAR